MIFVTFQYQVANAPQRYGQKPTNNIRESTTKINYKFLELAQTFKPKDISLELTRLVLQTL